MLMETMLCHGYSYSLVNDLFHALD